MLKPLGLRVTRLASGLPVGGDLEYADEVTLGRAFEGDDRQMTEKHTLDPATEEFAQQINDQVESFLLAVRAIARERHRVGRRSRCSCSRSGQSLARSRGTSGRRCGCEACGGRGRGAG